MSTEKILHARSESKCELCGAIDDLAVYEVPPHSSGNPDDCILLCDTCRTQIENPEKVYVDHWRCLNDSMWSQIPAVQNCLNALSLWETMMRLARLAILLNAALALFLKPTSPAERASSAM